MACMVEGGIFDAARRRSRSAAAVLARQIGVGAPGNGGGCIDVAETREDDAGETGEGFLGIASEPGFDNESSSMSCLETSGSTGIFRREP